MLSKAESIMLWANAIWMLGFGMFGPLYSIFAEDIGGGVMELSWVYAAFMIMTGLGIFVVGRYADRLGLELMCVAGFFLSAIATYGYLFVTDIWGLFIVQMILALSIALSEPTWYALYDQHSGDGSKDGLVWSLAVGYGYILRGVGMLLGGWLAAYYSFDTLFIVMGTILLLSSVYQARIFAHRAHTTIQADK